MTQVPQEGYNQQFNRSYSFGNKTNGNSNGNNNSSNGSKELSSNVEVSKSPPSKNLAHVPCKFYRQGACQAGSSCPFSHTQDSNLETAPCKYFTKGNCKFGLKCALAHILPDGRRVNPKSLAQVYQSQAAQQQNQQQVQQTQQNQQSQNQTNQTNGGYGGYSFSIPITNGFGSNNSATSQYNQLQSTSIPTPKLISPIQTVPTSSSSFNASSQPLTSSSTVGTSPFDSPLVHHPRTYSQNSPLKSSSIATSPFTSNSIWSNSTTATNTTNTRSFSHSQGMTSSRPLFNQTINEGESAILDDDEPSTEEVFEEDFVPSSLSDLLTPQELKRRGSRPGSSSVRPQFKDGEEEMQFRLEEDWLH